MRNNLPQSTASPKTHWKKSEDKGKARWEKVGVLIDKEGKKSIKLDLMPISKDWDGWLVVAERNF